MGNLRAKTILALSAGVKPFIIPQVLGYVPSTIAMTVNIGNLFVIKGDIDETK